MNAFDSSTRTHYKNKGTLRQIRLPHRNVPAKKYSQTKTEVGKSYYLRLETGHRFISFHMAETARKTHSKLTPLTAVAGGGDGGTDNNDDCFMTTLA